MAADKMALIIGASRGLGLGLVEELLLKDWFVVATERKSAPDSALKTLAGRFGKLRLEKVDINEAETIKNLSKNLEKNSLDLLFINAGVCDDPLKTIAEVTTQEFDRVMHTNALSPLRAIESLDKFVKEKGSIAVMSSGLASVSDNTTGSYEVYRASKAALNTLMRSYSVRKGQKRSLFAMSPGWVRTDMGGPDAILDVKTSVFGILETIDANKNMPGLKFLDYQNKTVAW